MKLLWAVQALADRNDIFNYIESENPAAALALDQEFSLQAIRLSDHPMLGRNGRVAGTRELIVHDNYCLIYDCTDDSIRILRVLHAKRRWPP